MRESALSKQEKVVKTMGRTKRFKRDMKRKKLVFRIKIAMTFFTYLIVIVIYALFKKGII